MRKEPLLILLGLFLSLNAVAQVNLMTYNIKYANENDGDNSWSKRKDFITNQLKFYEPDIFGVQEAVLGQLNHFTSQLNGYEFIGEGRDGGDEGEFSAILYKIGKFDVLISGTFWLAKDITKPSKGWDAAFPRICTYALFEEKGSGKKFWVFNTHFDHRGKKARRESAKLILNKIEQINTAGLPAILMGDLNLEPDTKPIQLISGELKDSRKIAKNVAFGSVGTFNGYKFHEPVTRRIDYIFVNDKVEVLKYGVLTDSKDQKYPSDHFPVLITAELE
ncbi:endonuclease/exonuclease/phosphatase family protein [Gramella jeungdoensis]|uniref:Endonuclease/exonuclease/phosphatase family protein n=1 Tax=Gramella jeungdoensis TaxID=708091 RepID=A0ABT0YY86_9FLAO|nr:endonuclease/exonuclease/phosphatase family protein [Gramella jeungdoensis]MCM8567990.1 endonuclease/exonuclease/phosphatase family protein [Gramella jeungdoensis]